MNLLEYYNAYGSRKFEELRKKVEARGLRCGYQYFNALKNGRRSPGKELALALVEESGKKLDFSEIMLYAIRKGGL